MSCSIHGSVWCTCRHRQHKGPEFKRATFLGAPAAFNLNQACRILADAFGHNLYLVGSSIERRDFRDVDVRCMLDDAEYERMFPNGGGDYDAYWSVLCTALSEWLSSRTGLPIDFQIQKKSEANVKFKGKRHALGIFVKREKKESGDDRG